MKIRFCGCCGFFFYYYYFPPSLFSNLGVESKYYPAETFPSSTSFLVNWIAMNRGYYCLSTRNNDGSRRWNDFHGCLSQCDDKWQECGKRLHQDHFVQSSQSAAKQCRLLNEDGEAGPVCIVCVVYAWTCRSSSSSRRSGSRCVCLCVPGHCRLSLLKIIAKIIYSSVGMCKHVEWVCILDGRRVCGRWETEPPWKHPVFFTSDLGGFLYFLLFFRI